MANKTFNVAVVGATGTVGETICQLLAQRQFPIGQFYPLASQRSAGERIVFNKKNLMVQDLSQFDFNGVDIALFSAGATVSEQYVPVAVAAGAVVIDNTSCFRADAKVPLVISEVNPHCIAEYNNKNIISNPNCSTIQMLVALKPLHDAVGIKRINVATYQSVSGSGRAAIDELAGQTRALLSAQSVSKKIYPKQIAFNLIPHIDALQENGYTKEEMKMVWETKKIFEDASIQVNPTAVRVPVFFGHSEAIHLETKQKITKQQAIACLSTAPGVKLIDETPFDYPTPCFEGNGTDLVYVGRVREDISSENGLNLWVVADNVRKGGALNAVQIAEILARDYLTV